MDKHRAKGLSHVSVFNDVRRSWTLGRTGQTTEISITGQKNESQRGLENVQNIAKTKSKITETNYRKKDT